MVSSLKLVADLDTTPLAELHRYQADLIGVNGEIVYTLEANLSGAAFAVVYFMEQIAPQAGQRMKIWRHQ